MARRIHGYILENDGEYLSGEKAWYHRHSIDAHVFPPAQYERIRRQCGKWRVKPTKVYPAYCEDGITVITGDGFKFTPVAPARKEPKPKPKIR